MSTLHFSLQVMTAPELQEPGPNRDACIAKLCSADCTAAALSSAHALGGLLAPVPAALQVPVLRAWLKAGSSKVSSLMLWGKRLFADYGGALPADRSNMGSGSGFVSAASCHALPESEEQAALARFQRGADVELVCSGGQAVPAHAQALMWASEELGQLVSRSWLAQGDAPGATPVDVSVHRMLHHRHQTAITARHSGAVVAQVCCIMAVCHTANTVPTAPCAQVSEDEADAWQAALVSLYPGVCVCGMEGGRGVPYGGVLGRLMEHST